MKYTSNYNLKKPEQDDFYNVDDFNSNADIIDQKLKENADVISSHLAETTQNAHLAKNIGIEDAAGNFTATDVEGALNELFTSVSNGKTLIATAITGKGVPASGSDTFSALAEKIEQIPTGKKWASGSQYTNNVTVTGLAFKPSKVIMWLDGFDPRMTDTLEFRVLGCTTRIDAIDTFYAWETSTGSVFRAYQSGITADGFYAKFTYTWDIYWIAFE